MEPELEAQEQSRPRRRSRRASGLNAGGAAEPAADTPGPGPDGRYSLRRGSSFTFLTPGPHWDFTLKRKRREKEDDVISLSSLDLKLLLLLGSHCPIFGFRMLPQDGSYVLFPQF